MSAFLSYVWMISWAAAIWTPKAIGTKLFLTGALALVLGVLSYDKKKGC